MIKLYRMDSPNPQYWETWEEDSGIFRVHWGELGTVGERKLVEGGIFRSGVKTIEAEIAQRIKEGFIAIEPEQHVVLMIEYPIQGMGSAADIEKRHRLEDRMNETLGWTGLGACDGGSIGSGTMEVCCFVVDFERAKAVIEADLRESPFADYTRIYEE